MNSEELELSLRTEFESYLKDVVATMRQDVADFQKNFEAEFEKHRSQMDVAFRGLSERFASDVKFDKAFTESVVEHLRLARDDGAQLTAHAFSEAQKLEQDSPTPARYDRLRDAISDISSQTTQSAILRSLVDHVSNLTPRGAFFIVKSDGFVCWRRFERAGNTGDDNVRDIKLPLSADTLLADAVRSLSSRDNSNTTHTEDSTYLEALGFGTPERMFAVPLIARNRGVAVLYADSGSDGEEVNLEAIESLVRVAGLTVELRAASSTAQVGIAETPTYVPMQAEEAPAEVDATETEPQVSAPTVETEEVPEAVEAADVVEEYTGAVAVEDVTPVEVETHLAEVEPTAAEETYFEPVDHSAEAVEIMEPESTYDADVQADYVHADAEQADEVHDVEPAAEKVSDFAFAPSSSSHDESPEVEVEPVPEYAYAAEPQTVSNGHSYEAAPEPVVEVASAQPVKSRFSDRNVDLPIEVSDDERRLHNDARRFARLLVSEIKLYNEQKVNEGRNASDLYDRLREAIDRSREMYDKRVQPQVAAKFDYFHYELVSNLAEGSDAKLGASYPGSVV